MQNMVKAQNIYYMLAYAFSCLTDAGERKYAGEKFDGAEDLFAAILANGTAEQIKRGLSREYVCCREELAGPRGQICMPETAGMLSLHRKKTVCDVDEYYENSYENRILKSSILLLLKSPKVRMENRKRLRTLLPYFRNVEEADLRDPQWSRISYARNNTSYRMLIYVCRLVIEGRIASEDENGRMKLKSLEDSRGMPALYEDFIRAYYKRHYPQFNVSHSQIEWNLDSGSMDAFLPRMQSDIMIEHLGKTLIIDAKYYNSSLQTNTRWGGQTVHSHNLYQIYSYVKNQDVKHDGSVSGMLLYANTEGENPDADYMMDGSRISVKTLDLNCRFEEVKRQLNGLMKAWAENNGWDPQLGEPQRE